MISKIKELFHAVGFWVLVILLCGACLGGFAMHSYQKSRINEAIKLGGFVFDNKIFEVKGKI